MISTEECVELAIRGLEVYVHRSEERLIQAARGDKIDGLEAASVLKRSKKKKRLEDWEEKVLHGKHLRLAKLAQKEYKRRHDNLGKTVHSKLAGKRNFEAGDK